MEGLRVGYAMCGSFCTLKKAIEEMKALKDLGADITPIMSPIVYKTDTRFGKAEDFNNSVREIAGKDIITTVKDAEPIGPKGLLDIMVVAPCSGNTLSKICNGITDTSVTMAVKAHLRNSRPVVLAVATNDALGMTAKNIGLLMNVKNIFLVPFSQDDAIKKPCSLIADYGKIPETILCAKEGRQIQPVLL